MSASIDRCNAMWAKGHKDLDGFKTTPEKKKSAPAEIIKHTQNRGHNRCKAVLLTDVKGNPFYFKSMISATLFFKFSKNVGWFGLKKYPAFHRNFQWRYLAEGESIPPASIIEVEI
jgi:hypothetical protein